ncbi:MAG: hypothetical protein QXH13_04380, partial [Thermoplasmata archaeon]
MPESLVKLIEELRNRKGGRKVIWVIGMPKVGKTHYIQSELSKLRQEEQRKIKIIDGFNMEPGSEDNALDKNKLEEILNKNEIVIFELNPYEIYYLPKYPEHIYKLWSETKENRIIVKLTEKEARDITEKIIAERTLQVNSGQIRLEEYTFGWKVGERLISSVQNVLENAYSKCHEKHEIHKVLNECTSYIPYISVGLASGEYVEDVEENTFLSMFKSPEFLRAIAEIIEINTETLGGGIGLSAVLLSGVPILPGITFAISLYLLLKEHNRDSLVNIVKKQYEAIMKIKKLSPYAKMKIEYLNKLPPGTLDTIVSNYNTKEKIDDLVKKIDKNIEQIEQIKKEYDERMSALEEKIGKIIESYNTLINIGYPEEVIGAIRGIRKQISEIEKKIEELSYVDVEVIRDEEDFRGKFNYTPGPNWLIEENREIIERVLRESEKKTVIITGEPGIGKTTILFLLFRNLREKSRVGRITGTSFHFLSERYLFYDYQPGLETKDAMVMLMQRIINRTEPTRRVFIALRTSELEEIRKRWDNECFEKKFAVVEVKYDENFLKEMLRKNLMENKIKFSEEHLKQILQKSEGNTLYISTFVRELINENLNE